uniref:Uncharacterized protein n=1 Tax=Pyxicephalus adspersus TaxID=30357 RepID=A0AAV2ZPX4_PYXAD|nr:TPA: hypothetical protein GDO54_003014 [Pyxicephalus adspersus]
MWQLGCRYLTSRVASPCKQKCYEFSIQKKDPTPNPYVHCVVTLTPSLSKAKRPSRVPGQTIIMCQTHPSHTQVFLIVHSTTAVSNFSFLENFFFSPAQA